MSFKAMMDKTKELGGSVTETANRALDEFNEALPIVRALGLDVKDLHVGMGLLPEVGAKLVGSIATVNVAKINEIAEKEKDKKLLVTILKTLQAAYNVKDRLGDLGLKGVEVEVFLGLPPKVSVGFVK